MKAFWIAVRIVAFTFIATVFAMACMSMIGVTTTIESARFVILLTLLVRVLEKQISAELSKQGE